MIAPCWQGDPRPPHSSANVTSIEKDITRQDEDTERSVGSMEEPWEARPGHVVNETEVILKSSISVKFQRAVWCVPYLYQLVWMSALVCLMAPFFPSLATSRGVKIWEYGMVLSAFKLAILPGSLLGEKFITGTSPRVAYVTSVTSMSVFCLLFGSLYWVNSAKLFLGFAILISAFGGGMKTIFVITSQTILTSTSHKNRSLFVGFLEAASGLGEICGQLAGGVVTDLWKLPTSYYACGIGLLLALPFITEPNEVTERNTVESPASSIDSSDRGRHEENDSSLPNIEDSINYYKLLIDPMFLVNMANISLVWVIDSYNDTTLEPYLSQFNSTNENVGAVFTCNSGGYSLASLLAGFLASHEMETTTPFAGYILSALAFLLVGPAPFLPFQPSVALISAGQLLMGTGMAFIFVGFFTRSLKDVIERAGYPDNDRTKVFVYSFVNVFLLIGGTITPPIAGYLVTAYGYRNGSTFMFALLSLWTLVQAVLRISCAILASKAAIRDDPENEQLLPGYNEILGVIQNTSTSAIESPTYLSISE